MVALVVGVSAVVIDISVVVGVIAVAVVSLVYAF